MRFIAKFFRFTIPMFCLVFVLSGLVNASSTGNGIVFGFLYDAEGLSPIEGAVVKIRNTSSGMEFESSTSDAKGAFEIVGMGSGLYTYKVSTSAGDFVATDVFGLTLKENESAKLAINLTSYDKNVSSILRTLPPPKAIEGETFVGRVIDYNPETRLAEIFVMQAALQKKDRIHALGEQTDFYQKVDNLKVGDSSVLNAKPGETANIRMNNNAQIGDAVYVAENRGIWPLLLPLAGVATVAAGSAAVAYNMGQNENAPVTSFAVSGFGTKQKSKK